MRLVPINELTEVHFQMIEEMASTGFPLEEIAEVIEVDPVIFLNQYKIKTSEVRRRYRKGFLQSMLMLRQRIFKDAGYGSSPAQTLAKKIMDDCEYKLKDYD